MRSTSSTKLLMSLFLMVLALVFYVAAGQTISSSNFESGGYLSETQNVTQSTRHSDDTVRVDPLDNLNKYRGGYDITNKHYWSSTAFTGIHGYVIGAFWLLCGVVYGLFLLTTSFCCRNQNRKLKKGSPYYEKSYLWPVLLAAFLTILAIVGCGIVLGGNAKFHSRAKTVVDIIIDTANGASQTIYNTTGAMRNISINLEASNVGGRASVFLNSTSRRLDSQAADIERQARKNRRAIDLAIKIVYIVASCIISLNLVAVIALSAIGILKLRRGLHTLIILCWILTVFCWVFFGLYFFLEKFEGDTCTALEDFQHDPYNNSLSSILPCDELLSSRPVLNDVSQGIYNLIYDVNANISGLQADAYIQICNPFSAAPDYIYQPENCPSNSIRIGDIPETLKLITCVGDAANGTCNGGIYISTSDFNTVKAYTTSIQTLIDVYPGMESLVECQTVTNAFREILQKHCSPLKRYTRMVWAAMVFLATVMVVLVLIWTTKARNDRKHHAFDGSVKPHFATSTMDYSQVEKAKDNGSTLA